jgi:hypothetical protein
MNTTIRNLGLGLMMTGIAGSTLAAENTFSVTEKVDLVVTPSAAWSVIKDFNGWQGWHPAFASTEITKGQGNAAGTVRVLTAKDGGRFIEELVSHDAGARAYQYRIIESPLPLVDYVSTLEVKENKSGSTVIWSSRFGVKPGASAEDIRRVIAGVYRAGLDSLAASPK